MKYIDKKKEPSLFTTWKTSHPGATYKDDLCSSDPSAVAAKQALKDSLIAEQGHLCCYCECRITSQTSHIEHFKPKGNPLYSSLQLDYSNLLASCTKTPTGSPDEHCGHKKGSDYSTNLVSPLETDCSSHFTYDINGGIGYSDNRGNETITMLHLDSAALNAKRKIMIDYFLGLDEEDINDEIQSHLDNSKTTLGEFYTTVEYLSAKGMFL